MPENPARTLFEFVLEKAPEESVARRVKLYRALATVIGVERDAVQLEQLAQDCEAIEQRHRQLALNFGKGGPAS